MERVVNKKRCPREPLSSDSLVPPLNDRCNAQGNDGDLELLRLTPEAIRLQQAKSEMSAFILAVAYSLSLICRQARHTVPFERISSYFGGLDQSSSQSEMGRWRVVSKPYPLENTFEVCHLEGSCEFLPICPHLCVAQA